MNFIANKKLKKSANIYLKYYLWVINLIVSPMKDINKKPQSKSKKSLKKQTKLLCEQNLSSRGKHEANYAY